jgi:hypothetical protein
MRRSTMTIADKAAEIKAALGNGSEEVSPEEVIEEALERRLRRRVLAELADEDEEPGEGGRRPYPVIVERGDGAGSSSSSVSSIHAAIEARPRACRRGARSAPPALAFGSWGRGIENGPAAG